MYFLAKLRGDSNDAIADGIVYCFGCRSKRAALIAEYQRGADKEAIKAAVVASREADARKRKTRWCLPALPLM